MPKKLNKDNKEITLYGVNNFIAKKLYSLFPDELSVGKTDIVSLGDNKIIMMIRDLGHALTLEIKSIGEEIKISYFIPKICNLKKVNKLPGINRVSENATTLSGTTGSFVTSKEKFYKEFFQFISMVPTDLDINFKKK